MPEAATVWRPPQEGEYANTSSQFITDNLGNFITTNTGVFLTIGPVSLTPISATVWNPKATDESEKTTWRPQSEGEMNSVTSSFVVDQSGNFMVDESGNFVVGGDIQTADLPATVWSSDPGL